MSLSFDLHAAGVLAPGLNSLADLRAACRSGQSPVVATPLILPSPGMLPVNERRRASQVVRLTLACIEQALQSSPFPIETLRSVFATDEGTGEVCQQMLDVLVTTRQISPLLFTNSVLNAPSGYFSIAWHNRLSSTVISMGLESFASGLLCAVAEATATNQPVLFVAYDPAMTAPIDELLPVAEPIATAWILSSGASKGVPLLQSFTLDFDEPNTALATPPPRWLPPRWAAQSSARAFSALSLLEAEPDAVCRLTLGGRLMCLQRSDRRRG